MDRVRQTLYFDKDLKEKLRYISYRDKITQNDVMKEALKAYFEEHLTDSDIKQIMALR